MSETLRRVQAPCLERSCREGSDWIRYGLGAPGIERAEAQFSTFAFEPHRHDTYAIGMTLAGVQTFRYRGSRRVCLPGQLHILHPDETHDGAAATAAGFRYRILYVDPCLLQEALDGRALPFVAEPVKPLSGSTDVIAGLLSEIDDPIDGLARAEIAVTLAEVLSLLAGREPNQPPVDLVAISTVREYLDARCTAQTPAEELERVAGLDRFSIARQFRRAFGTSPDRYRIMRRLGIARQAIEAGSPLAAAAAEAGFADQSHMTRQFKRAYGVTPGYWVALRSHT